MKRLFIKSVLATVALAAMGVASAQDIKERTIKFGLNSPEGHPAVAGMKKFKEAVEAKSGGKMKVQGYWDFQLGNDLQGLQATRSGTVDMVNTSTAPVAGVVGAAPSFGFRLVSTPGGGGVGGVPSSFSSTQEPRSTGEVRFGYALVISTPPLPSKA